MKPTNHKTIYTQAKYTQTPDPPPYSGRLIIYIYICIYIFKHLCIFVFVTYTIVHMYITYMLTYEHTRMCIHADTYANMYVEHTEVVQLFTMWSQWYKSACITIYILFSTCCDLCVQHLHRCVYSYVYVHNWQLGVEFDAKSSQPAHSCGNKRAGNQASKRTSK